jgi:hypothetical protein
MKNRLRKCRSDDCFMIESSVWRFQGGGGKEEFPPRRKEGFLSACFFI